MISRRTNDLPVPAAPVKKNDCPLSASEMTRCWSGESVVRPTGAAGGCAAGLGAAAGWRFGEDPLEGARRASVGGGSFAGIGRDRSIGGARRPPDLTGETPAERGGVDIRGAYGVIVTPSVRLGIDRAFFSASSLRLFEWLIVCLVSSRPRFCPFSKYTHFSFSRNLFTNNFRHPLKTIFKTKTNHFY